MKITPLSAKDEKRFTTYLVSRYGVPKSVMKDWSWYGHKDNVFIYRNELARLPQNGLNVFSVGMLAFSEGKQFVPAANFITFLGKYITQNTVTLRSEQLQPYFSRKETPLTELTKKNILSTGYVAVLFQGVVIGSASVTPNHLIPNLPTLLRHEKEESQET